MARIFLSLSGEGRGHATRVRSLVDALRFNHELSVFAPGLGYELLKPLTRTHGVEVVPIEGLLNHYDEQGRWRYVASTGHWLRFALTASRSIEHLVARMNSEQPDLVISDFEPLLPRAAARAGVPYMSIDHQHYLIEADLRSLPPRLRWYAQAMGVGVRHMCRGQRTSVISSFFELPLRPDRDNVHQVGVFLRPAVRQVTPAPGEHLLVYMRRHMAASTLDSLSSLDRPVVVYGLGERPAIGNLTFRASDEARFVADLASCHALFCTAGNQIVGEARHLGKPLLVVPETSNFEQEINAHFVRHLNLGWASTIPALSADTFRDFLRYADQQQASPAPATDPNTDGTRRAVELIERELTQTATRMAS